MKRSPATDPRPDDILKWKGWRIRVTRREGALVYYRSREGKKPEGPEKEQDVERWKGWAVNAKVVKRALEEGVCTVIGTICGPCSRCRARVESGMHFSQGGIWCERCCPSCSAKSRAA